MTETVRRETVTWLLMVPVCAWQKQTTPGYHGAKTSLSWKSTCFPFSAVAAVCVYRTGHWYGGYAELCWCKVFHTESPNFPDMHRLLSQQFLYLQDVVPWGQSAVTGCNRVSNDLLDDNVPQWCVFSPYNAKAEILLRLISEQFHCVSFSYQTRAQGGVVWGKERSKINQNYKPDCLCHYCVYALTLNLLTANSKKYNVFLFCRH